MTDDPARRTVDELLVDVLEQLAALTGRIDDLERVVWRLEREARNQKRDS